MLKSLPYVLVTAARNEAQFIGLTLTSVIAQTVHPLKWVIVSDGSTDGTDEIVSRYAADYPWIELLRMPERRERHFAGKVYALNAGLERLASLEWDVIGNLDADISFDRTYFAYLLEKMAADPKLGLVGGRLMDCSADEMQAYGSDDPDYVSGPCQIFRRACFEEIGGYQPMKSGGVDLVAVLSARMKGWTVRMFPAKLCMHHRPMNGAQMSGFRERLHRGRMDYLLGSHPLWEIVRGVYQMKNKPYVIGGILICASYFWRQLLRVERTMPAELIAFRRKGQMERLKAVLLRSGSVESRNARQAKTA